MEIELLEVDALVESLEAAPWAAKILEVEGGFLAFESLNDFELWVAQV